MTDPARTTVTFAVRGPIDRVELPALCRRACRLLAESGCAVVVCDVAGLPPDGVTVEALARLQLVAHHRGCSVRLCNASAELLELVAFMGLEDVLFE